MTAGKGGLSGPGRLRVISLKEAPKEFRVALVKELGYDVKDDHVVSPDGELYHDPYSGAEVSIDSLLVLPGRSPPLILDDSPFSLAAYFDEFGDVF